MDLFLQHVSDALTLGSMYALFALGIAVVFGVMRLVNFAYGELAMVGAYAFVATFAMGWPITLVSAIVVAVVFALAMERVAFRPLRGSSPEAMMVASFAVGFLLQHVAQLVIGPTPRVAGTLRLLRGSVAFGGVAVPRLNVITIVVTAVLLLALRLFLRRTTIGLQMRAASENITVARLMGIRPGVVISAGFAVSGLLAGVTSILLVAQTGAVTSTFGLPVLVFGLVAAVIGGLGSLPGAVVGGFLLGGLSVALQALLPLDLRPFRDAFLFATVFVIMTVRPNGLVAGWQRTRV